MARIVIISTAFVGLIFSAALSAKAAQGGSMSAACNYGYCRTVATTTAAGHPAQPAGTPWG